MALSFRFKLLLAMMLIVAGVTGATLLAMQRNVQRTYERLFQERFDLEAAAFAGKQQAWLKAISSACEFDFATIRFISALAEEDADIVYENAAINLKLSTSPLAAVIRESTGVTDAPVLLRFVAANGDVLQPPEDKHSFFTPAHFGPDAQQTALQMPAGNSRRQQVTYLPVRMDDRRELHEVISTPILDRATGESAGALLLALPIGSQHAERSAASGAKTGILIGDELFGMALSQDMLKRLADAVHAQIQTGPRNDSFTVAIEGDPHRAFYRSLGADPTAGVGYRLTVFPLNPMLAEQRGLRRQILIFGAAGLLAGLVLSALLTHGLTGPIRELVAGTREIQNGNFGISVPVRAGDELGRLAESFNEMAAGLAQREKFRAVLNMVADKKVAHELMAGEIALGGEVREVSVLFCDIRGFTALTENMPPERVVQMLNEHMTALTRIVYEHDGVVDKFVGDLIMAIFGAPRSTGNDTHNAAFCALRMIRERQKLNTVSEYKINVGIGVATGKALAGCMGSIDRLNYTVLGERVNLAARLCSQAGINEVVIDRETYELLRNVVSVTPKPNLKLKGFSETICAYTLVDCLPIQHENA